MKRGLNVVMVVAAGVAGAVLLVPRSSCACMTPEMMFESVFKVNPSEAGAVATRTAMLKVVPPGASAAEARAAYTLLDTGTGESRPRCSSDSRAIRCEYDLTESTFGVVRRSVRFAFQLDGRGSVSDITTELTTHVLGGEL